ncbi:MAG: hypothetical protein KA715_05980 [Xanthomonadaceae bacterium]|nr:hypothetical protein [Xanthomonadaceae bacterium]
MKLYVKDLAMSVLELPKNGKSRVHSHHNALLFPLFGKVTGDHTDK